MISRKKILIIIVICLFLGTIISNPSKDDYVVWLKENGQNQSEDILTKGVISIFGTTIFNETTKS